MPERLERRCISCRLLYGREALIRIIYSRNHGSMQLFLPHTVGSQRHEFGRSAYLCPTPECIRAALKGKKLGKTLKTMIPDAIVNYLDKLLAEGINTGGGV